MAPDLAMDLSLQSDSFMDVLVLFSLTLHSNPDHQLLGVGTVGAKTQAARGPQFSVGGSIFEAGP